MRFNPTPEQIAQVRATVGRHWTDDQVRRHLEQRAELSRQAEQQRHARCAAAAETLTKWGPM